MSDVEKKKLNFIQVMGSVLASFVGIQSNARRERDFAQGSAKDFILVGILLTLGFIGVVLGVVLLVMQAVN
jgi:hypothetical protein